MKSFVSIKTIDKNGRVVIPKKIRSKLNINSTTVLKVKLIKNRIIIQKFD